MLLSSALSCKHKFSLLKYYLVLNHLLYALNDVDDENGSKYVYKKLQTHAFGPICPQLNMNREEIQQSNIVSPHQFKALYTKVKLLFRPSQGTGNFCFMQSTLIFLISIVVQIDISL